MKNNMDNPKIKEKRLIIWLGILQAFIGVGAVPAGIAMIYNPSGSVLGMTVEMLINSPFADFLIPGIFLLVINGIGSLIGALASFLRHRFAGKIAIGLGIFLILWIAIQVYWLGLHWLHILYFILGIIESVLGLKLQKSYNMQKIK
jgi:hypothetical protein